ncbi:mannitol dehydrogenase family protein [Qingshengfaniella alkalisoli]|uniref:Mannitol dehydrogenase family protein n=1 Tax=Qingshengfaniella alkalisoli TaxID=2599296 RepID=A0A5B8IB82_9RHOB|nr:mannitol dehydrogenase family protein [Qingshengfaniella alkalisoli]QDY70656.1 mannitol dehydrogenase family protein [Qingshengfaniella alkalisoli]
MDRLTAKTQASGAARLPDYAPEDRGCGIVHLGLGAFHKAHQAVYTDDALARDGGDWRVIGVSLRRPNAANELTPQDGRYTLIESGAEGTAFRVIGSIARALTLQDDRLAVLDALTSPQTRIVSTTVTEKAYGIDRETGGVSPAHPAIAKDLANPDAPQSVVGLIAWALKQRKSLGVPAFTVLCCDNLPENGRMLRAVVLDYTRRAFPEVAAHITTDVAFPSTMVDRITPAASDETRDQVRKKLGFEDHAAIEAESFRQWVIEDSFPMGRPKWEAGGAVFVDDVEPYEQMKLRMLNGTHSMLAYSGFLAGHRYVRDVMQDDALTVLVRRHLEAAAGTLRPLPAVDFGDYAASLEMRFRNPHLAHETYQIAMDGTEKLPQRVVGPALEVMNGSKDPSPFAFAVAAWMRYVLGVDEAGTAYDIRDPRQEDIVRRLAGRTETADIVEQLLAMDEVFPGELAQCRAWRHLVTGYLHIMLSEGMRAAIKREAERV